MKQVEYTFQNIYLITTYRCNWSCAFCLFRFNTEKECHISTTLDRLKYSIENSDKRVFLKITGGEPLLRKGLLKSIYRMCESYGDKIYKVGIGTNGSIAMPSFLHKTQIRTDVFLSRHNMRDTLPLPSDLMTGHTNSNVEFRINCNMIKGGIDSVEKIIAYINQRSSQIDYICFRELNNITVDHVSMYPYYIYKYKRYYEKHLVRAIDIIAAIGSPEYKGLFTRTKRNGNYYDDNLWYWYHGIHGKNIGIKFRIINEAKLVEFNLKNKGVDEFVIHPDGTLTGCWDKELKIIKKGGGDINAKPSVYCEAAEEKEKEKFQVR